MGGGDGKCIYIYTDASFRPERVVKFAQRFGIQDKALDNINCAYAHNSDRQLQLLQDARPVLAQDRYALVIVDSCTHLFRSDYAGFNQLQARQSSLSNFLNTLKRIAMDVIPRLPILPS